jgi:hypothetical protein
MHRPAEELLLLLPPAFCFVLPNNNKRREEAGRWMESKSFELIRSVHSHHLGSSPPWMDDAVTARLDSNGSFWL